MKDFSKYVHRIGSVHMILRTMRLSKLHEEKWHIDVIDLNDCHYHLNLGIPVNPTRTFRCPLHLVREKLNERGTSSLRMFATSRNDAGERTYSNPLDGTAIEAYEENVRDDGRIL